MPENHDVSSLTLNRLSVYLRCLRHLEENRVEKISSDALAQEFNLSPTQIRKDLAQFGEFGIRGVGYDVSSLAQRLHSLLGLDHTHRLVIVGMGHLGSALAGYLGFNDTSFQVVAGVDSDDAKVGTTVGSLTVRHSRELREVVQETGARIGVITVPAGAAEKSYAALVEAGIQSILNFAPIRLKEGPDIRVKNVDLRIYLEEIAFPLLPE